MAAEDRRGRTSAQRAYDGPEIADDVSAKDLDRGVRRSLQSLPEKLADRVARHLVMAGMLLVEDPETAYRHARAARERASRIASVREACGEAAYTAGHYAEALAELRAAKRMNGQFYYVPMMADCERGLGWVAQQLPGWLEPSRQGIERLLPPVRLPSTAP